MIDTVGLLKTDTEIEYIKLNLIIQSILRLKDQNGSKNHLLIIRVNVLEF